VTKPAKLAQARECFHIGIIWRTIGASASLYFCHFHSSVTAKNELRFYNSNKLRKDRVSSRFDKF
jgi:hypothetical protein